MTKLTGWILIIAALVLTSITRFGNPHMTETELLLAYPFVWLAFIFLAMAGAYLATRR